MARGKILVVALATCAYAACPNHCSGHGECGAQNVCECDDLWTAYPDCSGRKLFSVQTEANDIAVDAGLCPNATAWVEKAHAKNKAHGQAECAGVGECNRNDVSSKDRLFSPSKRDLDGRGNAFVPRASLEKPVSVVSFFLFPAHI